jgi:hypothetical protein
MAVKRLSLREFQRIVSRGARRRNNLPSHETIFRFWRRRPETTHGYQAGNKTADSAAPTIWRRQMRTLSFLLALAFVVAGPSMAGSSDSKLPGVGTFAYSGSPVATSAPSAMILATR